MTDGSGSAVSRRQLGRDLRGLREQAHLSQDDAATALACSRQKIWRIETGAVPVRPGDVKVLCNLYGAGPTITKSLAALALQTRDKGWWQEYADILPTWFSRYVGLEAAASRLRCYQSELIPGLLQTRQYTEAVHRSRTGDGHTELERLLGFQSRRQALLDRSEPPAPRLELVLSEVVLHRRLASPEATATQLRHLHRLAQRHDVSLRVLPLTAGPTLASTAGAFVLLSFPQGDVSSAPVPVPEATTVYSESLTHASYLDRPEEVRAYERAWDELSTQALDEPRSAEMIRSMMAGAVTG